MDVTVAIDCMGGDHGTHVTVPAALDHLGRDSESAFILVGDQAQIQAELARRRVTPSPRVRIQHASEVITMNEQPATALRGKKDSSMRVAINLVKKGDAQACISAGNTGALMAISRFVLKTLPGIDRPAIATILPHSRATPTSSTWGRTSIARPSICCSSASWAQSSSLRSTAKLSRLSAC